MPPRGEDFSWFPPSSFTDYTLCPHLWCSTLHYATFLSLGHLVFLWLDVACLSPWGHLHPPPNHPTPIPTAPRFNRQLYDEDSRNFNHIFVITRFINSQRSKSFGPKSFEISRSFEIVRRYTLMTKPWNRVQFQTTEFIKEKGVVTKTSCAIRARGNEVETILLINSLNFKTFYNLLLAISNGSA